MDDDVAGIVCQAHVMCFHSGQETRLYNVEDDVAGGDSVNPCPRC